MWGDTGVIDYRSCVRDTGVIDYKSSAGDTGVIKCVFSKETLES